MNRKEIIEQLNIIVDAQNKRDEKLKEKVNNHKLRRIVEDEFDNKRPIMDMEEPKEPVSPSLLFKPSEPYLKDFRKLHDIASNIENWFLVIFFMVISLLISIYGEVYILTNGGDIVAIIVFGVIGIPGLVLLIRIIVDLIQRTSELKKDNKEINEFNSKQLGKYAIEVDKYAIEKEKYDKEEQKYLSLDKEYKENIIKYKEKLNEYNKAKEKFQSDIDDEVKRRMPKQEAINEQIDKEAEQIYRAVLSKLSLDFPEKYYNEVSSFIEIFEDCRADSVKEAVNVYLNDKHNEQMLDEQRNLSLMQEEENERRREEEDRKTRDREHDERKEAEYRCNHCKKYRDCHTRYILHCSAFQPK